MKDLTEKEKDRIESFKNVISILREMNNEDEINPEIIEAASYNLGWLIAIIEGTETDGMEE